MAIQSGQKTRILSIIAGTAISLACGTNYAYSAWAPQFADRLKLSATESNVIGATANFGMYASGIPVGLLVDGSAKGPRLALLMGASSLGLGYYPIYEAFKQGPGYLGVTTLCFFAFLTGFGSCSSFSASIKICAMNWPNHRGTATAFPLSAFGLSALFFTGIAGIAFPDDTEQLLFMLCVGTFSIVIVSSFFLRVVPTSGSQSYESVPTMDEDIDGNTVAAPRRSMSRTKPLPPTPGDTEISGLRLLYKADFWLLFSMMSLLAGVGLMTINNVGNDAQALWEAYDSATEQHFISQQQLLQVSILSFMSFSGRLISGIGSDYLVKSLHKSRFWCLVGSSIMFVLCQAVALRLTDPRHLWIVSSLTGLGYGALFGVFPALTADAFGVAGLSLNWGAMTMAPVLSGNVFNMLYGSIYDSNSDTLQNGDMDCKKGIDCYRSAYWVTMLSACLGLTIAVATARTRPPLVAKDVMELDEHEA